VRAHAHASVVGSLGSRPLYPYRAFGDGIQISRAISPFSDRPPTVRTMHPVTQTLSLQPSLWAFCLHDAGKYCLPAAGISICSPNKPVAIARSRDFPNPAGPAPRDSPHLRRPSLFFPPFHNAKSTCVSLSVFHRAEPVLVACSWVPNRLRELPNNSGNF